MLPSTPPLWGVHAAVPRTGEASPSVVQKPFWEVGEGGSKRKRWFCLCTTHQQKVSLKICKNCTHPYCGPKCERYLYIYIHVILNYKAHDLQKTRTQLFGAYLCNTPHYPKCDPLSRTPWILRHFDIHCPGWSSAAFKKCNGTSFWF